MNTRQPFGFARKTLLIVVAALAAALGGGYYYANYSEGIYEYSCTKDKQFICTFFKENWYWLIHDYSLTFSPEYMLDKRAASQKDPRTVGILRVKTYRVKGQPVGFVAYYPSELYTGRLLFLGVDKQYRSRGIARKLTQYALDDLKRLGVKTIWINTRTDNTPGRKLYESLGFKVGWTDGAYTDYKREA